MSFIVLLFFVSFCSGANILIMLPFSVRSHVNTFMPVFNKLVERGHNITMVSSLREIKNQTNWIHLHFKNPMEERLIETWINNRDEALEKIKEKFSKINRHTLLPMAWKMTLTTLEEVLKQGILESLLDETTNFDLMITETYFQEPFIVFSHIYGVPVINIEAHFPSIWSCYITGNICPSSYIPNYKTPFSDQMTFLQRLENYVLNLEELLGAYFYYIPQQEQLLRKYFRHPKIATLPPLISLLKNISITLVDSHFSQSYARPYHPNIVEVGGLTFNMNTNLEEDIHKYMNDSVNGVIYFTFGSVFPLQFLPKNIINAFISAFKNVEQNVIMKWDTQIDLPNKPNNVKTLPWAPQNSILAHPNCKLFISHGGIHSLTEAIYHGVPLLIVPQISDQEFNAEFAKQNGIGYVIKKESISYTNVLAGINEVLTNSSYKVNMMKRSKILKDKPTSSLDLAVYWVEYVIRHKGATHLRPASLDLNIFEYILMDISVIFILVSLLVATSCCCFVPFIIKKVF